jgi:hypothetical protein
VALNRARVAQPLSVDDGLSVYVVVVEFFDSADPSTVMWAEQFRIPFGSTTAQLQALVIARGQTVRASLASLAAAQAAVPVNTTVTVP